MMNATKINEQFNRNSKTILMNQKNATRKRKNEVCFYYQSVAMNGESPALAPRSAFWTPDFSRSCVFKKNAPLIDFFLAKHFKICYSLASYGE